MDCTLMHKHIPVVDMTISMYNGNIEKHGAIHNPAHLPLGTTVASGKDAGRIVPLQFNDWWIGRSIPASRDGIREALETLEVPNTALLISKCCGLSLSDQYWICPANSGLTWETVNFFQNGFSKDIGEILFGHDPKDPDSINLMSPDNTSDGWLRKKWIIAEGKRYLMKGGSGVFQQEPFNEVIACAVMRRLNIPHVAYTLKRESGKVYSLCENFITPDTELIAASRVRDSLKRDNRHSGYTHLLRCCDELGIPGVRAALDRMLVVDYIIANEDRHYNNFGFIRNAETLEWLGTAPIYDSGTSLWHDTPHVGQDMCSKPFCKTHAEQIKLVEDLTWFEPGALRGLSDEIMEVFHQSDRVDEKRSALIASSVMTRCEQIEEYKQVKKPSLLKNLHDKQSQVASSQRSTSGKSHKAEIE